MKEAKVELRYMGFEQKLNVRAYRFEGIARGEPSLHFIVTADMSLFLEHHIGLQEGPSLCARKLAESMTTPESAAACELTRDDLLAHVAARATAEARRAESRRQGVRRHNRQTAANVNP